MCSHCYCEKLVLIVKVSMNSSKALLEENIMQMFIEQKGYIWIVSDPEEIFSIVEESRHTYMKPL